MEQFCDREQYDVHRNDYSSSYKHQQLGFQKTCMVPAKRLVRLGRTKVCVVSQNSKPYSDHCDGIGTLIAEENRQGIMEQQEKHQLKRLGRSGTFPYSNLKLRKCVHIYIPPVLTVRAAMRQQITLVAEVEVWPSYP
jgi:hypothetical protein